MNTKQLGQLIKVAVFANDDDKKQARWDLGQIATDAGIYPASINDLYMARGANKLPQNFTVPAMNLRGMTYDLARAMFKAIVDNNVGVFVAELARSEIGYTDQAPQEYVAVLLAAALREGYVGPVCIQGDHFQAKAENPGVPKNGEVETIKKLMKDAIDAGFYNIDIDMSTLVDLDKPSETEQQKPNVKYSAELTEYVRSIEPEGVTVSLGGEIGHIGGVNSKIEDLIAYMDGYASKLADGMIGMSKISVQTGSHHGGVVLADGKLADIDVDFSILKKVSEVGREKYGIGGSVQHGASTLPDEYFKQFVESQALEVHLATGFQNIQMDHPAFPKELLDQIYDWLDKEVTDEKKSDWNDDQFHYKMRKKGWGKFKKECWDIPEDNRNAINKSLVDRFEFLFKELNVVDTVDMAKKWIPKVIVEKSEKDFEISTEDVGDVKGLSD